MKVKVGELAARSRLELKVMVEVKKAMSNPI